jgi:hypothetical protein
LFRRTGYDRIADERGGAMVELMQSLRADNAEHVAPCYRIEEPTR